MFNQCDMKGTVGLRLMRRRVNGQGATVGRVMSHLSWVIGKIGNRRNPPQSPIKGEEEILMMPSDEWGIGDSRFTPLQHVGKVGELSVL